MNDLIGRQDAIDAADRADYTGFAVEDVKLVTDEVVKEIKKLPSAQESIKDAISVIRQFLNDEGKFLTTCIFMTKDGIRLCTDWGYFEEGLDEIERYAERRKTWT